MEDELKTTEQTTGTAPERKKGRRRTALALLLALVFLAGVIAALEFVPASPIEGFPGADSKQIRAGVNPPGKRRNRPAWGCGRFRLPVSYPAEASAPRACIHIICLTR